MPKANYCNYHEAYSFYLKTGSLRKTKEFFHKRDDILIREFKKLGYEYPIKRIRKTGYNINNPSRKDHDLIVNYFGV